jgi:twinkle protein
VVFLDHISILISGMTGDTTNERTMVDAIVHRLRVLCSELDLPLILVSHLRRPSGDRGHEEGAKVSMAQLRSSHSIAQLSDACIGLEVDPEEPTAGIRNIVVLKNRHTGEVGPAGQLQYDRDKGRLLSIDSFMPF